MDWNPPERCQNGHVLQPPNVKVGWVGCECGRATGAPKGHRYMTCWTCKAEWRENGCDQLP